MGLPIERLAINQITTRSWGLGQAIDGYARAGVGGIAIWRDRLAEIGVKATRRRLKDAGMRVTGLNRAGPLLTGGPGIMDDARHAIEEAAALEAQCLMLFAGGLPEGSRDLPAARQRFAERAASLLEEARQAGVTLALEPLHPVYAAERSVMSSLEQANALAETLGEGIGIVVDAYHVWWDPVLAREVARAGPRICGFHVSDWLVPTRDPLTDRGMMGDGIIDLPAMRHLVETAGYKGDVEVEIFSERWWAEPADDVVRLCIERYQTAVLNRAGFTGDSFV